MNVICLLAKSFCNTLQLTKNSDSFCRLVINLRHSEVNSSANLAGKKNIRKVGLEGNINGALLPAYSLTCTVIGFVSDVMINICFIEDMFGEFGTGMLTLCVRNSSFICVIISSKLKLKSAHHFYPVNSQNRLNTHRQI